MWSAAPLTIRSADRVTTPLPWDHMTNPTSSLYWPTKSQTEPFQ